ncbi:MAG TPA: hypothetical protein VFU81_08380, partial [Thermomicrobiales bacterium]|nr:hypothetical protein [Thermomicrobiales bacterium]
FWGKLALFASALNVDRAADTASVTRMWFLFLAVVGALNAAMAAAYYLKVVAAMYFRPSLATPRGEGGIGAAIAAVYCSLLVVLVGVLPGLLVEPSSKASIGARARAREAAAQTRPTESPPAYVQHAAVTR